MLQTSLIEDAEYVQDPVQSRTAGSYIVVTRTFSIVVSQNTTYIIRVKVLITCGMHYVCFAQKRITNLHNLQTMLLQFESNPIKMLLLKIFRFLYSQNILVS